MRSHWGDGREWEKGVASSGVGSRAHMHDRGEKILKFTISLTHWISTCVPLKIAFQVSLKYCYIHLHCCWKFLFTKLIRLSSPLRSFSSHFSLCIEKKWLEKNDFASKNKKNFLQWLSQIEVSLDQPPWESQSFPGSQIHREVKSKVVGNTLLVLSFSPLFPLFSFLFFFNAC